MGFWWAELTHPYWAFTEAGHDVEIRSPDGEALVADRYSDPDDSSGYSAHVSASSSLRHAALISETASIDGTWTGFANSEERFSDTFLGQRIQPFWIEDEARAIATTIFVVDQQFRAFTVRLLACGIAVRFGVREVDDTRATLSAGHPSLATVSVLSPSDACRGADVLMLAVPANA